MVIAGWSLRKLLDDLGDHTGTDGPTTLTDRKAELLLHSDRGDQLDLHLNVITRHYHLDPLRERDRAGDIGRTEVELRTRSEEHTSELQSRGHLVCRLLLEKKNHKLALLTLLRES